MDLSTLELADNMDLKAPANAFLHYLCIYYKNTDLPNPRVYGTRGSRHPSLAGLVFAVPIETYLMAESDLMDFIRILFAILLPPLGVFLQVGFRGAFWLNILLTLFGYIPGIVHAVWIIARR